MDSVNNEKKMFLESPYIVHATSVDEVNEITKSTEYVCLLAYQDWCHHCVWFKEAVTFFAQGASQMMGSKKVRVVALSGNGLSSYWSKIGVKAYPSMKVLHGDAYTVHGTLECYGHRWGIERKIKEEMASKMLQKDHPGQHSEKHKRMVAQYVTSGRIGIENVQKVKRRLSITCLHLLSKMIDA